MEFISFDEKRIFMREWLDVKEPKGVVQIVHGMAEHAGRYENFAQFLNKKGYLVVADDHRGHGRTDADMLGYCKGDMFQDTLKDEGEITKYYKGKYPDLKYILLGFSYGSFLAQAYLAKYGELLDGAIVAGSSHKKDFEVYLGSAVCAVVNLFGGEKKQAKLLEKLSFDAYKKQFDDRQWLSIDGENNTAYYADPLCAFTCSYRFYADFFKGLRGLYTKKYRASLPKRLPLLLISGADDPVGGKGKGVKKLYRFYTEKAGMEGVQFRLFEGSRHEFLNEKQDREEKWGAVLAFIESVE